MFKFTIYILDLKSMCSRQKAAKSRIKSRTEPKFSISRTNSGAGDTLYLLPSHFYDHHEQYMIINVTMNIPGTDGKWGDAKQSSETGPSGPLWGDPPRYLRYGHHHHYHHYHHCNHQKWNCCIGLLCQGKCFIGKSALIVEATNLNICFYILVDNKPTGCSILMMMMMISPVW